MILILYTTLYRKGGDKFQRIAKTMLKEIQSTTNSEIVCQVVESKNDVRAVFHKLREGNQSITEFHFIGHSGMYGPMFGTVEYPEQFSPYEWEQLDMPLNKDSKAFFHCCRSARWFAPYFARTYNIDSYGYHWYTTFSARKDKFKLDQKTGDTDAPLYCFGHIGKKSHGYRGSIKKYLGLTKPEKLKLFCPEKTAGDTYNEVATLYDQVFQDIRVRQDEWGWITSQLDNAGRVLDIGCGNGALLKQLSNRIELGVGVDESEFILERAAALNGDNKNISFNKITGPKLPFQNNEFDTVISMLSFRYLDWDPMMNEIYRVLKEDGKVLIIDMVTAPVKLSEYWKLLEGKIKHYRHRKKFPEYYRALSKLVSHPKWKEMLKYNPIRSEHEMKWFLQSRFPSGKIEIINVGWNARILAFSVENSTEYKPVKLTYP